MGGPERGPLASCHVPSEAFQPRVGLGTVYDIDGRSNGVEKQAREQSSSRVRAAERESVILRVCAGRVFLVFVESPLSL